MESRSVSQCCVRMTSSTGDSSEKEFLKAMSTFGIEVEKWRLKESLNLGDRYLGYLIVNELDNRGKHVIFSQKDSARE